MSHTLSSLLAELKSLFFYEEQTTLRDKLRFIVTKYEQLTKEEGSAPLGASQQDRSRSTSLDTKERLKAFIHRQDYLNRRADSETQIGSVTLKNSSKQPHHPMSKEDFDEIDLRNSIQSIDQRLSVLIG
mmetsp:Transcript_45563/g.60452  ORF Transcript_45563/g.60452 Transcript_45563/m.60452 type:complete len:129 (-) Transcript_45563:1292-1678(-)